MAGEVHVRTWNFAFSLNKQSDIFTPAADAAINKKRPVRTFAPSQGVHKAIGDKDWFGKGHPWATFYDRITQSHVMPSRETSATNLDLLWACGFVMGKVVTTGGPEYSHVITFEDLSVLTEVRYTSFLEALGSQSKKKYSGAWVNSFRLHGKMDDHLLLSWEGGAREQEDSTATLPETTEATFFKTIFGTVAFGPFSAMSTGICGKVLDWQVDVAQGAEPKYMPCGPAGEERLITKVLRGKPTIKAQIKIEFDAGVRDNFLDDDLVTLQIVAKSEDIIAGGSNQHMLTADFHACKIAEEDFSEDGETVAYTFQMDEQSILKSGLWEPLTLTLLTDISGSEILVNG